MEWAHNDDHNGVFNIDFNWLNVLLNEKKRKSNKLRNGEKCLQQFSIIVNGWKDKRVCVAQWTKCWTNNMCIIILVVIVIEKGNNIQSRYYWSKECDLPLNLYVLLLSNTLCSGYTHGKPLYNLLLCAAMCAILRIFVATFVSIFALQR